MHDERDPTDGDPDESARVGADEAGRGPVLGSMFVAAVRAPPSALPQGLDDSKRLSPARREALAADLRASDAATSVVEVGVDRIDDPGTDLTALTVEATARALAAVADGAPDASVILDACDVNADRYARRVADACEVDLAVDADHGADADHPVVSAASILAKVERDAHVADLAAEYDRPLGSGYPSDDATRAFLREHVRETGDLPDCARRSWATSRDALAAAEQSALEEF